MLVGAVEVRFSGGMDTINVCCGYFRSTEGVRVHPCQGQPALEKWGVFLISDILLPANPNPRPRTKSENSQKSCKPFPLALLQDSFKGQARTLLDNNCEHVSLQTTLLAEQKKYLLEISFANDALPPNTKNKLLFSSSHVVVPSFYTSVQLVECAKLRRELLANSLH